MAEPDIFTPVGHPDGMVMTPPEPDTSLLKQNITRAAPGSFRAAQEETGPRQATAGEAFGAGFRHDSDVLAFLKGTADFGDPDPEHNPLDSIRGTAAEPYWNLFIGSRNQKETDFIMEKINKELEDQRTLAAGGWAGYAGSIAAGIASPTLLIPGGIALKSGKIAANVAKSAAASAGLFGGASLLQEMMLQHEQATRSNVESAINVGSSVLLGALFGAGAAGIASGRLNRMAAGLDLLEAAGRGPTERDPFGAGGLLTARSVGAAENKLPRVDLENTGGLASAPVFSVQDPVIRVLNSPSAVSREIGVELFETTLATTRNRGGITTAPAGGSVETRIKTIGEAQLGETLRITDTKFGEYYFGKPDVRFRTARSTIGEYFQPTGKLTHKQFREEVGRALSRNDEHAIPEVREAALELRKLFDRHADTAIEVGNLDAEVVMRGRPTGQSLANPQANPQGPKITQVGASPEQAAAFGTVTSMERAAGVEIPEGMRDDLALWLMSGTPEALAMKDAVARLETVEALQIKLRMIGKVDVPPGDIKLVQGVLAQDEAALATFTARVKNEPPLDVLYQDGKQVVDTLGMEDGFRFMDDPLAYRENVRMEVSNRFNQVRPFLAERMAARGEDTDVVDEQTLAHVFDDKSQSYAPRYYKRERISKEWNRFVGIITDHFAEAQVRASRLLSKMLNEGIDQTDKSFKELQAFVDMAEAELKSAAEEVAHTIMGASEGRLLGKLPWGKRGPLKPRTLRIKDTYTSPRHGAFEDFLERDSDMLARLYTRTVVPDNEIARRFGTVNMAETFKKLDDDYARMKAQVEGMDAPDGRKMELLDNLEKMRKRDDRDLKAIVERLRGTYMVPDNPMGFLPRFGRLLRTFNFMRLLGGMTVSALTDVPRVMMTQGLLTTFRDGVVPLLNGLRAVKMSGRETKLAGTALDMILSTRSMAIADVMDQFGRYSKFERALGSAQDNFGTLALMNPWNSAMKQWVGMIVQTNILRYSLKVLDGTAGPRMIRRLAAAGISPDDAKIIAEQWKLNGAKHGAVYLPNTKDWNVREPRVRNALESYRAAIVRDVDRTVVTPGQDRPLWMSTEVGKIVGQFKSFSISTVQRTMMAGMQERDAGVLVGALSMIALGVVVERLKAITNEKELPKTDAQWIATAIDRSGITGYLFDVNHFAEAVTGGTIGISALTGRRVSRYASRNYADAIMGPTAGLVKDILQGTGGLSRQALQGEQINESDVRALRRSLPYQNLFYLSWLFRQVEGASSRGLGAKPMKRNSMM